MNTRKLTLVALLSLTGMFLQAQTKSVALPPAAFANTRSIEIGKVTLTDTATVLDIEAFFTPGYWIKIVSDSYLNVDGKKYMIRSGEGIDLDSLFWMPKSGEASFKLVFEPMPSNTQKFDFIESDCEDCFKIYGIDLVNKRPDTPKIPQEYLQAHQPESGFSVTWQKGEATVSGQLLGHIPGTLDWTLVYRNPITGKEKSVPVDVAPEGTFNASVTVYSPTNLQLISKAANVPIKVAPGKESKLLVNLPEIYREGSQLFKDREPYGKRYYYAGYLAQLNNELLNEHISYAMQSDYLEAIDDSMDANGYKAFVLEKYHESIAHNDALDISSLAKKIVNATETFSLHNKLLSIDWIFMEVYAEKHNLPIREASKEYKPAKKSADFNDYYQLIPYNDMELLLLPNIAYDIRYLSYASRDINDHYMDLRYLAQHEEVAADDRQFFTDFIAANEKNEEFEGAESIESIFSKYQALAEEFMEKQTGAGFLSQMWNSSEGLLLDLIKAQKISKGIQDFNPLTDEQQSALAGFPEMIRQSLDEENEALLALIEENKKKTGYRVHNTPENANEELFAEMLKPFKGKVVLVDVWATWCGPCRMANKEMEPLKAQLADEKDLVYLYLAGDNSPENTWKNMIVDLKGDHYRVNQAQWDYLSESLKAQGVPTYIIIDREGNQSFHHTGFPGADAMKRELFKALKKEI